ncbi:isoprenylcysteine carboxylmethyltransferase family protein [Gramella jeungdoensis]|uniref:Isoprenylcysteine carboxylmethyltransferase family protein n=1 Tax=Gramella jeungdoensis TaxID=708091 RepID=A0ABT0YX09_9FLAO|nr:isoprenylcysteine carboxylmethyltransferase family protein [Gramella jeungdoensis]MCM8567986.1 isoprenylcysteine carboxylmethyltransferase family protein [Gramella jeungdoensis]
MRLQSRDFILVALQAILFVLYIFDLHILDLSFPSIAKNVALILSIFGVLIFMVAILQLNKNLSPFPSPRKNSQLVKNGLYKYVRHPIYSGILIALTGFAIYTSSGYRVMLTIVLYILFDIKSNYEEKLLTKRYKDYKEYRRKTGRFFPRF